MIVDDGDARARRARGASAVPVNWRWRGRAECLPSAASPRVSTHGIGSPVRPSMRSVSCSISASGSDGTPWRSRYAGDAYRLPRTPRSGARRATHRRAGRPCGSRRRSSRRSDRRSAATDPLRARSSDSARRTRASSGPNTRYARSPGIDTRSRPLGSTCRFCASDAAAVDLLGHVPRMLEHARPKSVTVSLRVVRSSSRSPSCASSAAMRRDTVDFGRPSRSAARLKLPSSTTRAKSRRSLARWS